ncbi:MAG: cation diffusion facilitator family transporter [Cyanobacteria bacterium J06581_3]
MSSVHDHSHESCGTGCAHHGGVPTTPEQVRSLRIALVFVTCFSAAELWVSLHSNSLSLLADAGHMACDVFAIALSLWTAARVAHGVEDAQRLNAIAALVNGVLLLAVCAWLGWEAVGELRSPPAEILSWPVAMTAAVGLGINGLNAYLLHGHADDNLNMRGAFLHMVADASSCLGVLVGAVLISVYGWYWADGVVSSAIALLIASSAVPLIRQSWTTLNAGPGAQLAEKI